MADAAPALLRDETTWWIEVQHNGRDRWSPWADYTLQANAESELARLRERFPESNWRLGSRHERIEVLDG